jgi:hypothetical protein
MVKGSGIPWPCYCRLSCSICGSPIVKNYVGRYPNRDTNLPLFGFSLLGYRIVGVMQSGSPIKAHWTTFVIWRETSIHSNLRLGTKFGGSLSIIFQYVLSSQPAFAHDSRGSLGAGGWLRVQTMNMSDGGGKECALLTCSRVFFG